jgi:hypothetical protein
LIARRSRFAAEEAVVELLEHRQDGDEHAFATRGRIVDEKLRS